MRQAGEAGLRRVWPWLVLAAGLGLATMPAWRALAFGIRVSAEDLLQIRCLPW
ncbi:hypothetical protein [Methylobacterium sp. Leaf123]|uniref:hypothetical protein n=1 Tax=Methylobacterium sp. Leaf123 TaxID=1736264 RepID=UPI000A91642A|nr:hypothetical protein [Methylobacterium sp. Leaf123]